MSFSERMGYSKCKAIQLESMSPGLRNRLYNFHIERLSLPYVDKRVLDRAGIVIAASEHENRRAVRTLLLLSDRWYIPYDVIEIAIEAREDIFQPYGYDEDEYVTEDDKYCFEDWLEELSKDINVVLEQEKAGYRLVNRIFVPITNEEELTSIEESCNTPFSAVNGHMQKALSLFADRNEPDYENSIKDSISAVEAICCIITNSPKATLGEAIKKLTGAGIEIHGAMAAAFEKLYGYTSDADGIRHGGMDFQNAPAEDAKFMLVACSAFINYLTEKYAKIQKTD